jgi:hypothetical protein
VVGRLGNSCEEAMMTDVKVHDHSLEVLTDV